MPCRYRVSFSCYPLSIMTRCCLCHFTVCHYRVCSFELEAPLRILCVIQHLPFIFSIIASFRIMFEYSHSFDYDNMSFPPIYVMTKEGIAQWRPSSPTAPPFLAPLPHLKSKAKSNNLSYFRKYATKICKNVCF